jgi:hypothetical protein
MGAKAMAGILATGGSAGGSAGGAPAGGDAEEDR